MNLTLRTSARTLVVQAACVAGTLAVVTAATWTGITLGNATEAHLDSNPTTHMEPAPADALDHVVAVVSATDSITGTTTVRVYTSLPTGDTLPNGTHIEEDDERWNCATMGNRTCGR